MFNDLDLNWHFAMAKSSVASTVEKIVKTRLLPVTLN